MCERPPPNGRKAQVSSIEMKSRQHLQPYRCSIPSERYKFLRQSLTITGAGTPTFMDMIKSSHEIYQLFHRQFVEGTLQPLSSTNHAAHIALDMTNRYFTPKRDAPGTPHLPFTNAVDPYGILEKMVGSDYVHAEESEVYYYTLCVDEEGTKRCVIIHHAHLSTHCTQPEDTKTQPPKYFVLATLLKFRSRSLQFHLKNVLSRWCLSSAP